jgi:hypothetical protein
VYGDIICPKESLPSHSFGASFDLELSHLRHHLCHFCSAQRGKKVLSRRERSLYSSHGEDGDEARAYHLEHLFGLSGVRSSGGIDLFLFRFPHEDVDCSLGLADFDYLWSPSPEEFYQYQGKTFLDFWGYGASQFGLSVFLLAEIQVRAFS